MAGLDNCPASLDGILSCPICFEDYGTEGDVVPRLLPCTHTLCENCMKELFLNNSLECPECRKRHTAESGLKGFPQNKYILSTIKRKSVPEKQQLRFEICEEHSRDLNLYCTESFCQNLICSLCLSLGHRGHDVVDLQQFKEEKCKALVRNITSLTEDLKINQVKIMGVRANIEKNMEACRIKIENSKRENIKELTKLLTETYDTLKQNVNEHSLEVQKKTQEDIHMIDTNLQLLDSIIQSTNPETSSHENILNDIEVVESIGQEIEENLSGVRSYEYTKYNKGHVTKELVEKLCGKLRMKKTTVSLSGITEGTQIPLLQSMKNLRLGENCSVDFKCTGKPKTAMVS